MSTNRQVEYTKLNDKSLLNLFRTHRDRCAVRELYERYSSPICRFLSQDIDNQTSVADAFNTILLNIIAKPAIELSGSEVSTQLFAMAYQFRLEYREQPSTTERSALGLDAALSELPSSHKDVLELVYEYDFTFDQAAAILGCSTSTIRNRWSEARRVSTQA